MPDIRTGVVTSVGKMAKTITVTTRTMNPVPKLLVVSLPTTISDQANKPGSTPYEQVPGPR